MIKIVNACDRNVFGPGSYCRTNTVNYRGLKTGLHSLYFFLVSFFYMFSLMLRIADIVFGHRFGQGFYVEQVGSLNHI